MKTLILLVALLVFASSNGLAADTPTPKNIDDEKGIRMRSCSLKNGQPTFVVRNNNPFCIRNVRIEVYFKRVTSERQLADVGDRKLNYMISDLIPPGTDYEFSIYDEFYQALLEKHSHGKQDEWIPLYRVITYDKVRIQ
jgi:hypothetical protein